MTDALLERTPSIYEGQGSAVASDDIYFAVIGFIDGHMTENQCFAALEAAGPLTLTQAEKDEFHEILELIPQPLDLSELVGLVLPPVAEALQPIEKQPQYNYALKVRYALMGLERHNPLLDTPAEVRSFLGLPTP